MRIVRGVLAMLALSVSAAAVACGGSSQPPAGGTGAATPAPAASAGATSGPKTQPYANLAQVMRALPFPSSNIIFDAQTHDPGAPKKTEGGTGGGASSTFANIYTGWPLVEHSALALAETANLIMIPGRLCQNGKPVPLDQEDFRKAAQGLVDAGLAAHKAAQAKNQEQLVEVSNQVAEACAACHEIYRDAPTDAERCTPKSAAKK